MDLDPVTHAFHEIQTLDFGGGEPSPIVPPLIDDEGNIWFSGIDSKEHGLLKLDTRSKSLRALGPGRVFLLDRGGDRIFYLSMKGDKGKEKGFPEIGLFHPKKESFEKLAELKDDSIKEMVPWAVRHDAI